MKVSTIQYAKTLLELTENKSQEEVLNIVKSFAEQLKKDGQLKNSNNIIEKFSELYNSANGIVEAEITTRYELQDTRYKEIEDFIKSKYKAEKVEIKSVVNEDIKGGIVIRIGDEVIDGSVDAQLKKLKNVLSK